MASKSVPSYKITYYPVTGVGEPLRMALALGEAKFEDIRVPGSEMNKRKPDSVWGHVPTLEVTQNDTTVTLGGSYAVMQSVLRYLGKTLLYDGMPLYPVDAMEAYQVDEILASAESARNMMGPTFSITDQTKKEAARSALMEPGGATYKILAQINARIKGRKFSAGDKVSVADLHLVNVCNMCEAPSFFDGFKAGGIAPFANLVSLRQRVVSLPPLVAFYKDADGNRAQYKPKPIGKVPPVVSKQ